MKLDSIREIAQNMLGKTNDQVSDNLDIGVEEEVLDIPFDDLIGSFGQPFVYRDIVRPDGGFGDVSYCYNRVVHPVLCELFNSAIDQDPNVTDENFKRLLNFRHDEQISDGVLESLTSKVWLCMNSGNRHVKANSSDVIRLCAIMLENVAGHILDVVLNYEQNTVDRSDGNCKPFIQIEDRCSSSLIPPNNPLVLRIVITYGWIYM